MGARPQRRKVTIERRLGARRRSCLRVRECRGTRSGRGRRSDVCAGRPRRRKSGRFPLRDGDRGDDEVRRLRGASGHCGPRRAPERPVPVSDHHGWLADQRDLPRGWRKIAGALMASSSVKTVGIVGAGLVGSAWAIVFARAGVTVRAFDASEDIRRTTAARIRASLEDMAKAGLVDGVDAICSRVTVVDDLRAAVSDVDYVQELVFERIPEKREVSEAIGALIRDDAVVGSSSSGIPASAFTEHVPRRERFLIGHPVNPPHLVPVVELCGAPWTSPETVSRARDVYQGIGQVPVTVNREIEGFVLNRLQAVVLTEALRLVADGVVSPQDLDHTMKDGLGLRWSFMGPFETIELNAPGGVDDYALRLGPLYHSIAQSRSNPRPWSPELIERARSERAGRRWRRTNFPNGRHGETGGSWPSSRIAARSRPNSRERRAMSSQPLGSRVAVVTGGAGGLARRSVRRWRKPAPPSPLGTIHRLRRRKPCLARCRAMGTWRCACR